MFHYVRQQQLFLDHISSFHQLTFKYSLDIVSYFLMNIQFTQDFEASSFRNQDKNLASTWTWTYNEFKLGDEETNINQKQSHRKSFIQENHVHIPHSPQHTHTHTHTLVLRSPWPHYSTDIWWRAVHHLTQIEDSKASREIQWMPRWCLVMKRSRVFLRDKSSGEAVSSGTVWMPFLFLPDEKLLWFIIKQQS